jgi:hypothetical protein
VPTIAITTPANNSPMPANIVGTYGASALHPAGGAAPATVPLIMCYIYRQDNGLLALLIPGQRDVPAAGQWTANVTLAALPPATYFIVAIITQDGQADSASVSGITKT